MEIIVYLINLAPHFQSEKTRFNFFSSIPPQKNPHDCNNSCRIEQRGVVRSNCIDCLDRTNVAQV